MNKFNSNETKRYETKESTTRYSTTKRTNGTEASLPKNWNKIESIRMSNVKTPKKSTNKFYVADFIEQIYDVYTLLNYKQGIKCPLTFSLFTCNSDFVYRFPTTIRANGNETATRIHLVPIYPHKWFFLSTPGFLSYLNGGVYLWAEIACYLWS